MVGVVIVAASILWGGTPLPLENLRGLGVRNLRNAKYSLMAKYVFMALNCENKLWVHISHLQYGTFHCWGRSNGKNVSNFH